MTALAVACGFLLALFPVQNSDFWLHLATGRWISQEGRIPHSDPFTFTIEGQPWIYHEWLFGWLQYQGFEHIGASGLVLLKALLVAATFGCVTFLLCRKRVSASWVLFALFLALGMARFRFLLRPQIISLLFFALTLCIVERAETRGWKFLLALVPIQLIWANSHGSFLLSPGILFTYGISAYLRRLRSEPRDRIVLKLFGVRLLIVSFLLVVVSLVNPYGYRLLGFPFLLFSRVTEVFVVREWGAPERSVEFALFWISMVFFWVGLLAAAFLRKWNRYEAFLIGLLLSVLACSSRRHIEFFALFFLVHFPQAVQTLWGAAQGSVSGRAKLRTAVLTVAVALSLAGLAWHVRGQALGLGVGIKPKVFAGEAARFLEKSPLSGRLYNPHPLGGWLTWSLYPKFRVFIDSRLVEYPREMIVQDYFPLLLAKPGWDQVLDKYAVNVAVVEYERSVLLSGSRGLGNALFRHPQWALVYWDDLAMLFCRRRPEALEWIAQHEFRAVAPDDLTLKHSLQGSTPNEIQGELERALRLHPTSFRVHLLMAQALRETAQLEKAGHCLERASELEPRSPVPLLISAQIHLDVGNGDEARAALLMAQKRGTPFEAIAPNLSRAWWLEGEFERAARVLERLLKEQPDNAEAYGNLGLCLSQLGRYEQALEAFDRALQLDSSSSSALSNRIRLLIELEDWEGALQDAQSLVRLEPSEANRLLLRSIQGKVPRTKSGGESRQTIDLGPEI